MDVSVPSGAEVRRTKLEPELYVDGQWIIYPMEVRVVAAVIPERRESGVELGGVDQPSDSTARAAVEILPVRLAAGTTSGPAAASAGFCCAMRCEDLALARSLESPPGARLLPEILKKLTGESDGKKWCAAPVFPEEVGPEWYLRVRDALLRMVE